MNPELTPNGVQIQSLSEILTEFEAELKAIYGDDIDLSQNTPDGQRLGIMAKLSSDLQQFALNLYAQFDPDYSQGEVLNKIIKIAGITRNPATRSSVAMTITTDRNLTLPSGYIVKDSNNNQWLTTEDYVLTTGANTDVTFYAEFFGNYSADANIITEPITSILGVVSINNPLAAVAGVDEETDEQLRIRRNKSLENPAYSTVGSLYARLANLEGVEDLQVYENFTDTYDATRDMVAHSIWVVISGGDSADIIETIALRKTAGTAIKGNETGTYNEEIILDDGTIRYIPHVMKYDRPASVDLYVNMTVTLRPSGGTIDTDLIKQTLSELSFDINGTVTATELYATVYQAGTNFIATDLEISDDDITFTDESLQAGYDERFIIQIANIDITEV